MKVPERYRVIKGFLKSNASFGNNGAFQIPHPKISNYTLNCIVADGEGWDHVSVTVTSLVKKVERCPTWEEMCFVKSLFWEDEESVMQLHPPKSQWVNNHPYCLHMWRPQSDNIPLPPSIMVGFKSINTTENETR